MRLNYLLVLGLFLGWLWGGNSWSQPGRVGTWEATSPHPVVETVGNDHVPIPESDFFMDVAIDSQGNVIVVSLMGQIVKYSPSGAVLWKKYLSSMKLDYEYPFTRYALFSLDVTPQDEILVVGNKVVQTGSYEFSVKEPFVAKFDASGNQVWYKALASSLYTVFYDYRNLGQIQKSDIHVIPGTDHFIVSSGDFYNDDMGQYDYVEGKISDGSIVRRWNKGCVADIFSISPDGKYLIHGDTHYVGMLALSPGVYTRFIKNPEYWDSYGDPIYVPGLPFAEKYPVSISKDGTFMALASSYWNAIYNRGSANIVRYSFYAAFGQKDARGSYTLDKQVTWNRGYYYDYSHGYFTNQNRVHDMLIGPTGHIFVVGSIRQDDPESFWNSQDSVQTNQTWVNMGYAAALSPEGRIIQERLYNNGVNAEFLAGAVDASGKLVVVGYREDFRLYHANFVSGKTEGYKVFFNPYIVTDALGSLPAYRYIRPAIQHQVHDPVSPVTGNYVDVYVDLHYPTAGLPLVLKRTYSSRLAKKGGPFGYGWSSNLFMHIESTEDGITVFWGDGHGDDFLASEATGTENTTKTVTYTCLGPDPGYSLTEHQDGTEHYFEVYIKNLDRTIRLGTQREGRFYPSEMFQGSGAYPVVFTYLQGTPSSLQVEDKVSGRKLVLEMDENGHVIRATGVNNQVFTYSYDEAGNIVEVHRADGSTVSYSYDENHHLTKVVQGGQTLLENTYDAQGRVVSQKDALGHETTFSYDLLHRKTTVTAPDGTTTTYSYDANFRLTKVEDESGAAKIYTYNALGQLTSITMPGGVKTRFVYDQDGRLTKKIGPLGEETSYTYDAEGRLVAVEDPSGAKASYHYTDKHMDSWQKPKGGRYLLSYADTGQVQAVTDPLGATHSYAYGASCLLALETRRDNVKVSYERDATGRVIRKTYDGLHPVSYTFDALGRLTSVTNDLGQVVYAFNARGYKSVEKGIFGEVTYHYDAAGRLVGLKAEGLTLTTQRRPSGRPEQVATSFGQVLEYHYDPEGRLTQVGLSRAGVNLAQVSYVYDEAGRLTGISFRDAHRTFRTIELRRDAAGRISGVEDQGAPGPSLDGTGLSLAYNAADRISTAGFAYDASGRLTTAKGTTYVYDYAGRLKGINSPKGTLSLFYDGLGRLVKLIERGAERRLVYSGSTPIVEKDERGQITSYFLFGPGLSLVLGPSGAIKYILLSDWRKNIVAVLSKDGDIVSQRLYSPYGMVLGESRAWPVPFGFLGEAGLFTLSSGLVLTKARAYDPTLGRFLTPDPKRPDPRLVQTLNPYLYAWDDPVNLVDSSGLSPFSSGPRWLVPGWSAPITLHPTNTLDGVAYPPMNSLGGDAPSLTANGDTLADATPIYSDRASDNGGGNTQLAPNFDDSSGLVASPIYSDRDGEIPPPTPAVAAAPGEDYVAGISTVPIVAVI